MTEESRRLTPQALLLTFCGGHVLGRTDAVAAGSLLEVLRRVGIGEHATRAALTRMARRRFLVPHRLGRRVYYTLSTVGTDILREASHRVWERGVANRGWDGSWTLLAFSLPESRRADRHLVRSRLHWAGFGPLQGGLWIAPYALDPGDLFADLDVDRHVKAFHATRTPSSDPSVMIGDVWDLEALRVRYQRFLDRWDRRRPAPEAADDLSRQLLLLTEWLLLCRDDPWLPVEHLPADWPGLRAEEVALTLRDRYSPGARKVVEKVVERAEPQPTG